MKTKELAVCYKIWECLQSTMGQESLALMYVYYELPVDMDDVICNIN